MLAYLNYRSRNNETYNPLESIRGELERDRNNVREKYRVRERTLRGSYKERMLEMKDRVRKRVIEK